MTTYGSTEVDVPPGGKQRVVVQEETDATEIRAIRFAVWKNTVLLGLGFMLLMTGAFPMVSVQSSLNSEAGLGTIALSVQTGCQIVASAFLTTPTIKRLGTKYSLALGSFFFSAYIAANFYPTWATLVPAAAISAVGTAVMWTAQYTYLTKLSQHYAAKLGQDASSVNVRFFGIFFAFFYASSILGNVSSSLILGLADSAAPSAALASAANSTNATSIFFANLTSGGATLSPPLPPSWSLPYDPTEVCGAAYCNQDLGTSFKPGATDAADATNATVAKAPSRRPNATRVYALCSFCLAASICGSILLTVFLDPLAKMNVSEKTDDTPPLRLLAETLSHLRHPYQLLLLPITFYNGMDNYFINVDISKAYVTCPLGIQHIGVVAACSAAFSILSSFVGGWFNSRRTRSLPFIVAALSHIGPCVGLLFWNPGPETVVPQYLVAASWGIGSGVWSAQLGAYYGIVFADNVEAACSNLILWNSLAQMILYGMSHLICITTKIYFILTLLVTGMAGYAGVEVLIYLRDYRSQRHQHAHKTVSLASITKHVDTE